jgi:hypothetical protein
MPDPDQKLKPVLHHVDGGDTKSSNSKKPKPGSDGLRDPLADPLAQVALSAPKVEGNDKPKWATSWDAGKGSVVEDKKKPAPVQTEAPPGTQVMEGPPGGGGTPTGQPAPSDNGTAPGPAQPVTAKPAKKKIAYDASAEKLKVGNFSLSKKAGSYSNDGVTTEINKKGVSRSKETKLVDGSKEKNKLGVGKEGVKFTNSSTGADGVSGREGSVGLGPDGLSMSSSRTGANGKTSGVDVSLGKKTGATVNINDKYSVGASYDKEKGFEGNVSASMGNYKASLGYSQEKGVQAGLGNKTFGASVNAKFSSDQMDLGGSLYIRGIGGGGGVHKVWDRKDESEVEDDLLGKSKNVGNLNESGWNAEGGAVVVNGGGWSNDTNRTGTLQSDLATKGKTPEQVAARQKELAAMSKGGSAGFDVTKLNKGEGVTDEVHDKGGWNAGVDALGIANYGYSSNSDDFSSTKLAKRENDVAAQNTVGKSEGSQHDYGALWGVYSGKNTFQNTSSNTMTLSGGADQQKLIESYSKSKSVPNNLKLGQEIAPGVKVEQTGSVKQDQYANEQSLLWGLGKYKSNEQTTEQTDARLTHGGSGAAFNSSKEKVEGNKVSALMSSTSSDATQSSSSQSGFVGAQKPGQSKTQNNADFKRLSAMAQNQKTADVTKMKAGETVGYSKSEGGSSSAAMSDLLSNAKFAKSGSNWSSSQATKTERGVEVQTSAGKQNKSEQSSSAFLGASTSSATSEQSQASSITVTADGNQADAMGTLNVLIQSGLVPPVVLEQVKSADDKIASTRSQIAAANRAKKPANYLEAQLRLLTTTRQKIIDDAQASAATRVKPGQKLAGGAVVTQVSTKEEGSKSESESSFWGLGSDKSSNKSASRTKQSALLPSGKTSTKLAIVKSDQARDGSNGETSTGRLNVTSGPEGTQISMAYAKSAVVGDATKTIVAATNLGGGDVAAIAARYNEGQGAPSFWAKLGTEASGAVKDPKVKAAFSAVKSPADFQKLKPAMQQAFIDGVLGRLDDSNPFETIAAIELLNGSEAKVAAYEKMFGRIESTSKGGGPGAATAQYFKQFVDGQAKGAPQLQKQLASKIKVASK